MPTCPSCGATVARAAAFCGECGSDVPESRPDDGLVAAETAERIKRAIEAQRAAEDTGWLTPRSMAVFFVLLGLSGLTTGYWLGFVGYRDVVVGPRGYGMYTITHPAIGIGVLLGSAVALVAGLVTLWRLRT